MLFNRLVLLLLIISILVKDNCCIELDPSDASAECDDNELIEDEDGFIDYDESTRDSVKFYLLTPDNQTVNLNSTNLNLVNTSIPTKILIHGLSSYENTVWVDEVAYNYHTKGNYNIIAVDWLKIANNESFYFGTVVDSVGNLVGSFIIEITRTNTKHLTQVHLIGSSVGAQIGAAAGNTVAEKGNGKVDRLTALDPTVPENLGVVGPENAEFVDVIHTTVLLGEDDSGTVDFYVTTDNLTTPVCNNGTCGELLGSHYFGKSIIDGQRFYGISCYNATAYIAKLCEKAEAVVMGEEVSRNATGSYLVAKAAAICLQGNLVLLFIVMAYLVL